MQVIQNSIMPITVPKLITHLMLWRPMGFMSSIVGFTCYALSPSFQDLFGKRDPLKMVIYILVSSIISILMLFVKRCRWEILNSFLLKAHVGFLVLTLTSLYSYWEDRSEEGKDEKGFGRVMNLTSTAAFAFMAMSLSRQLQLGFEVGIFNFLLGCFLVTVMKMNFKLAPLAALFCYLLINIRSFSDFLLEMCGHGPKKEHVDESVDHQDTNSSDDLGYHYDNENYVQATGDEDFGYDNEDYVQSMEDEEIAYDNEDYVQPMEDEEDEDIAYDNEDYDEEEDNSYDNEDYVQPMEDEEDEDNSYDNEDYVQPMEDEEDEEDEDNSYDNEDYVQPMEDEDFASDIDELV